MIDPTQQAAPTGQPPKASGVTVCIAPQEDGSFKVYPEEGPQTMQGGYASSRSEDQDQSAPDIDAAFEIARQMLTGGKPEADEADAMFGEGFNQVRG